MPPSSEKDFTMVSGVLKAIDELAVELDSSKAAQPSNILDVDIISGSELIDRAPAHWDGCTWYLAVTALEHCMRLARCAAWLACRICDSVTVTADWLAERVVRVFKYGCTY